MEDLKVLFRTTEVFVRTKLNHGVPCSQEAFGEQIVFLLPIEVPLPLMDKI